MDDLMRKYLWMDAMKSAVDMARRRAAAILYPHDDFHEWKHIDFDLRQHICLEYALDHWYHPIASGEHAGYSKYFMGWHIDMDAKGVTSEYKDIEIFISWDRVKKFIRDLLDWEPDDKQLTMFELLAQEAMNDH